MTGKPATSRALRWVVGLTSTAYFMVVLDSVVVITALPRMHRDLHVGVSSLQWTVNAYGIAFAAGIITAAALGDRFGRRLVFSSGLALFTLASAACALAPNASELIVARTVQGLGAAAVLPLSLTILTTAFPPEKRGMIVGVYGGLAGLAVALGPIVGGAITEAIDWHWIFWINVPIGLAAVVLGLRLLPESHGAPERLDLIGVVARHRRRGRARLGAHSRQRCRLGQRRDRRHTRRGSLLLAAFLWWEHRAAEPMVPLRLFASREFAIGNLTTFLMSGATFAAALLPHPGIPARPRLLAARHRAAPAAVLRHADVRLAARRRALRPDRTAADHGRRPRAAGTRVHLGRRPRLARNELDRARHRAAVAGIGISMALPTVPTAVLSAVAPDEMGKASGINYMAQRFGTVFAIAIASAVFSANGHLGSPASVTAGFRPALWACAAFAVLAALTAFGISPRRTAAVAPVGAADLPVAA